MTRHGLDCGIYPHFHPKKLSLSDVTDNMQNQCGSLYHSSWTVNLVREEVSHGAEPSSVPHILIHLMEIGMSSLMMKVHAFKYLPKML